MSSIPAGSVISSATLQLYVNLHQRDGTADAIRLYNVTKAWTESGVTQQNTGNSIGSIQDTVNFPTKTGWITFTVPAALVQSWVDNAANNLGLQIRSSNETHVSPYPTKKNYLRIDSAQSLNTTSRPKLTIDFTPLGNVLPNVCLTVDPKLVINPTAKPTITADAADPDGTIANVKFYIDGVLKGTDTTPPYELSGYDMIQGQHDVHAVAEDNVGATKSSATYSLLCARTIFSENMDAAPAGWTLDAQFEHGTPSGVDGSTMDGYGEPAAGYTGTKILGYQLDSPYYIGANTAVKYASTPAIDCSNHTNVQLRFHRWLGIWYHSSYPDDARVEVSNNGSTWTTLFSSRSLASTQPGGCWSLRDYDISSVADNQPTVYVRWTITAGAYGSQYAYTGWNIDDVYLYGERPVLSPVIDITNFSLSGGDITIVYSGTNIVTEPVPYYCTNLLSPIWVPVPALTQNTNSGGIYIQSFALDADLGPQCFYKIVHTNSL